jgi:hAT family C-terminal dimerisation region
LILIHIFWLIGYIQTIEVILYKILNYLIFINFYIYYFIFLKGIGLSNNLWKQIAKYAGDLLYNSGYKSKNAASKLIANMANFKCKDGIYSLDYEEFNSPQIWWKFVNNEKDNLLQKIALKLFAIVPHSASCERNFSGLGWFYGTRQQNLSLTTIESMSKIRHFYLTNTHNELQYNSKNYTEEELVKILKESTLFNENELEDDDQNDDLENEEVDQIPQHEIQVLIIAKDIDLENPVFNNEIEDKASDTNSKEDENESEEEFDINEIINNISF